MKNQDNISVCGSDCGSCYCFGNLCQGCNVCMGKVFHVAEGEICAIYDCVKNTKHLNHCGECDLVPCQIWLQTRDPKFSDEEFKENIAMRIELLGCK